MSLMRFVRKFGDPTKRSTWKALGFVLMLPVILFGVLWITLTAKPLPVLTLDEVLLEAVLIDGDDLPWGPEAIDIEQPVVQNGIGKGVGFRLNRDRPWINIRTDVYVYQTEDTAKQGYQIQCDRFTRYELQGWEAMSAIAFLHHADEIRSFCTEGYINGEHHFACEVVGRYGRVVTIVGGNIYDKRWLTAEQFREVLIKADQKANQSRKDQ